MPSIDTCSVDTLKTISICASAIVSIGLQDACSASRASVSATGAAALAASAFTWLGGSSTSGHVRPPHQELGEERDRAARRAFLIAGLGVRPGDVEVRPTIALREACEEARRRHAAGRASAEVGHVGEVAFQLLLILVPERHAPRAIAGRLGARVEFLLYLVVVRVEAARATDACC